MEEWNFIVIQADHKQLSKVFHSLSSFGCFCWFSLAGVVGNFQSPFCIYSACFMVLYGVLACCMMLMFLANRKEQFQRELAKARADNFLMED